jgi:hypothetical protein
MHRTTRARPSSDVEAAHHKSAERSREAELLGISQGNVSRLEGRSDVYLSTLRSYIEALGGHLEIAAVFDDQRLPVNVGPNQ